jgi:hypothetical protein
MPPENNEERGNGEHPIRHQRPIVAPMISDLLASESLILTTDSCTRIFHDSFSI